MSHADPYTAYLAATAHPLDCAGCRAGRHFYGPFRELRASMDYTYHQNYPRKRQATQDRILQRFLSAPAVAAASAPTDGRPPRMLFTAGAMGAGKGYSLRRLCHQLEPPLDLTRTVLIDPDQIKEEIPEYAALKQADPSSAGTRVHNESAFLQEILFAECIRRRASVIIDGSLRAINWNADVIRRLRLNAPHYHPIEIFYVHAPEDVVLARAAARGAVTGRHVPTELLRAVVREVPRSVSVLSQLVDATYYVENDDVPRLVRVVRPTAKQRSIAMQTEEIVENARKSATAVDDDGELASGNGREPARRPTSDSRRQTGAAGSASSGGRPRRFSSATGTPATAPLLNQDTMRLYFRMNHPNGGLPVAHRRYGTEVLRRTFSGGQLLAWLVGQHLRPDDAALHAQRLLDTGLICRVRAPKNTRRSHSFVGLTVVHGNGDAAVAADSSSVTQRTSAAADRSEPVGLRFVRSDVSGTNDDTEDSDQHSLVQELDMDDDDGEDDDDGKDDGTGDTTANKAAAAVELAAVPDSARAPVSATDKRLFRLAKDDLSMLAGALATADEILNRNLPIQLSIVTFAGCSYGEQAILCASLLRLEMGTALFRFCSLTLASRDKFGVYLRRRREARPPTEDVLARLHASSPLIFIGPLADGDDGPDARHELFLGGLDRMLAFLGNVAPFSRSSALKQFEPFL